MICVVDSNGSKVLAINDPAIEKVAGEDQSAQEGVKHQRISRAPGCVSKPFPSITQTAQQFSIDALLWIKRLRVSAKELSRLDRQNELPNGRCIRNAVEAADEAIVGIRC